MAQQRMRTHTEYDHQHLTELQRVLGSSLTRSRVLHRRVANTALGVAALVLAVALAVLRTEWICVVLPAGIGLYFLAWGLFQFQLAALATLRALKPSQTSCNCFLERSYLLMTNADGVDGQQYRYEDCLRLFETEGNLYFILKDGQGVVLDKANLKGGTVDQLRTWMEEKTGKKAEWMGKGSSRPDKGA